MAGQPLQSVDQIVRIADHAPLDHVLLVFQGGIAVDFAAPPGETSKRGLDGLIRDLSSERSESALNLALVPPNTQAGSNVTMNACGGVSSV